MSSQSKKNNGGQQKKSKNQQQNKETAVCYCGGQREVGTLELYCNTCSNWFHGKCLRQLKNFYALSFMVCYNFQCENCSPTKEESWTPRQANFAHMCVTALANLAWERMEKSHKNLLFSLQKDIIPFFTTNWENLTSMPRRVKLTWHQTLHRTMLERSDIFYNEEKNDDVFFQLIETDFSKIGPNHEIVKTLGKKPSDKPGSSQDLSQMDTSEGPKTRGAKRKAESQVTTTGSKKTKGTTDYTSTKFSGYGVPVDHPFNRDGYRYFLVQPDIHAPNRKEFDELEETAGKPIPAYMYRMVIPSVVELSSHDRAPQLKICDDHLTVTGEKGYSVIRCTHGVNRGNWYFEVKFLEQPNDSHVRMGWSQSLGCLQAPIGYDKFSYSWRSRKGTKFHESIGKHYRDGSYGAGDVLGFYIELPETSSYQLPDSRKTLPLIKFKNHFYYEEKDEVQRATKIMKPLKGSKITFYHNGVNQGVAYTDIYNGTYYPAISLYKNATVRANFGPKFEFPPKDTKFRPMSERSHDLFVEQSLADTLFFVENEGNLTLD